MNPSDTHASDGSATDSKPETDPPAKPLPPAKQDGSPPPMRPRLTLRVAFAGNRKLPEPIKLQESLDGVFSEFGAVLAEIQALARAKSDSRPLTWFYRTKANSDPTKKLEVSVKPLFRLVTGLAKGGDLEACEALKRMTADQVETELAAVLPQKLEQYKKLRAAEGEDAFDEFKNRCAYILEADGRYRKEPKESYTEEQCKVDPITPEEAARIASAQNIRARSYRLQADLLLRQSDVVVAAFDPSAPRKAGGTAETIGRALAFEFPVVVIDITTGRIAVRVPTQGVPTDWCRLLRDAPLAAEFSDANNSEKSRLREALTGMLAGPTPTPEHEVTTKALEKFFSTQPPSYWGRRFRKLAGKTWGSMLVVTKNWPDLPEQAALWPVLKEVGQRIVKLWKTWVPDQPSKTPAEPTSKPLPERGRLEVWRDRAKGLSYAYTDCYRGGMVLTACLAFGAVLLASGSLFLSAGWEHVPYWVFLGLASLEFGLIVFLLGVIHRSRGRDWADRAVNLRYLAERFRTMSYLVKLGSFQPATSAIPRCCAGALRQNETEWFFAACMRDLSPKEFAQPESRPAVFAPDVLTGLTSVKDEWLGDKESRGNQANYHSKNKEKMHGIQHSLEQWITVASNMVLVAVGVEVVLLAFVVFPYVFSVPKLLDSQTLGIWKYALVWVAALFPAAIAGLNGLRFQSESQRLEQRSDAMQDIVRERRNQVEDALTEIENDRAVGDADPGAHLIEALRECDAITRDMTSEVAEWCLLYSKELTE